MRRTIFSLNLRATIIMPMGKPLLPKPAGTVRAGWPDRLMGLVNWPMPVVLAGSMTEGKMGTVGKTYAS